jgi:transcriptional regulator with XRE-family HTH domain
VTTERELVVAQEDEPAPGTLAAKLDRLFRIVHPPGRGEYTYEEVAAALKAQGGPTISNSYVWQLRKGIRDNPTKRHLEALAQFFGVEPSYFFDEAASEKIAAELELLAAIRDSEVRSVAMRAAGLSAGSLDAIRGMIEHARRLEGLPGEEPPASP